MEEGSRDNHEETPRGRGVRRRLFADEEDNNETSGSGMKQNQLGKLENDVNCFIEETRNDMDNAKKKWNFDFEKEEPLPGQYEWVKVGENFSENNSNDNLLVDKNISCDTPDKLKEEKSNSSSKD
ncbi:hypothetical protein PV325_008342 [Microctonus aethiopoides]|nr:hypothetical protein PV325_008342 [Microctonus aethiopoides]